MKRVLICILFYELFNFFIFSQNIRWIDELGRNKYMKAEQVLLSYSNNIRFDFTSIFDHSMHVLTEEEYPEEERKKMVHLKIGEEILLDEDIGFTYFINNGKRYLYIIGDNHPIIYRENKKITPYDYNQNYLHNKTKSFDGSRETYTFDITDIRVSSFLTEHTKSGVWKYDGKDIEKFPILNDKTQNGDIISHISMPWVEGIPGDGIGEWIEITCNTDKLFIVNGFVDVRRPYLFKENNRLKEATVICIPYSDSNSETELKLKFEDFVYIKTVQLPFWCKKIRVIIDDVYKGTKYSDTVITSIFTEETAESL